MSTPAGKPAKMEAPNFRVQVTSVGPQLLFCNIFIRSWLGTEHDHTAFQLAERLNSVLAASAGPQATASDQQTIFNRLDRVFVEHCDKAEVPTILMNWKQWIDALLPPILAEFSRMRAESAGPQVTGAIGGTIGLDQGEGATKRDWETDGPAWEKRALEAEAQLAALHAGPQVTGLTVEQAQLEGAMKIYRSPLSEHNEIIRHMQIKAGVREAINNAALAQSQVPDRLATMLYRSLERLSLAIEGCAGIGFQESSPTQNAHHASIWRDLNDAQKDAKLKLKHYQSAAPAARPEGEGAK